MPQLTYAPYPVGSGAAVLWSFIRYQSGYLGVLWTYLHSRSCLNP